MTNPIILVAEAKPDLRTTVRTFLEESGFRALPVGSAADMWQALDGSSLDAVVLDTGLQGAHGIDLCREVRARSDIPLILIGAHSSEIDRVVGLELGADDFLSKPFSTRELVARLRAVLRRGRNDGRARFQQRNEARFAGWTVNFARREVRPPVGAPIDLTGAEFELLATMMDHAQRVIARDRLMEMSGGRKEDSSDRSVDVLVSRLRRKLNYNGEVAPIVTVRGIGYMFSAAVVYS